MKNVLLLFQNMQFYKIAIFNEISKRLAADNYNLITWYTGIDDKNNICKFNNLGTLKLNCRNLVDVINKNKIDIIINHLNRSDPGYMFYLFCLIYSRISGVKVVFYGHGINKQNDSELLRIIFNALHYLCDGIILFSPNEKEELWGIYKEKITVANNTLYFNEEIAESIPDKSVLKNKYKINNKVIVLSTGRFQERKRIEILAELFTGRYANSETIGWILAGPCLDKEINRKISKLSNVYNMGPVYDNKIIAEIFTISDIYCIPGALGLGIVEAIHWGLPVVTLNVKHGPELYYLKNSINGFITEDKEELYRKIELLSLNDNIRNRMSKMARKVYNEEAKIEKMYEGIIKQLKRF